MQHNQAQAQAQAQAQTQLNKIHSLLKIFQILLKQTYPWVKMR